MMPWNPIHRYAGLQSSFDPVDGASSDPFGNPLPRRTELPLGSASGADGDSVSYGARRPLGFVDVRNDATDNSAAAEPDDEQAEQVEPETPAVGSADADDAADDTGDASAELDWATEPEPVVVSPEAVEPTPVHEAEERVPFYKREISFGRKKSVSHEAPRVEAVEAEPVATDEANDLNVADDATDVAEKVPFFKREISLRRRRDDVQLDADDPVEEVAAVATEPVPSEPPAEEPVFEARQDDEIAAGDELHWPEQDAETAEVAAAADAAPETETEQSAESSPSPVPAEMPAEVPAPVAVKTPLHKRELSFGRKHGPKSSSGGRGGQRRNGGKVVGLKIGASQLAAAVVQVNDGRPELVELARTPLEAGIVVDGEIRDAEALTNALRSFFADQKLPTRDVRIGISSNRIGVRTFEMAGIEEDARFDNAVRFKAHEVLPIAVNESVLDYRVLDERRGETGETTRRILLVVAPRDQVEPYAEVAQRAGLRLAGIDLEALGLLRAFVEPQDPSARKSTDTATVVVAIGQEASTLLVSGGGVCEFTRVFDWGGGTLTEAIAHELDVRPAEAGTILRHLSLAGSSPRIEGLDDEARSRVVDAVRLRLTPFARELVSSLQFYQTQPDSLGIGEIVITGGTSQLDGLTDALHQMIGVAVRLGDPLQRVSARRGVEAGFENVIGSLSVAIGLGIDDGAVRSVDLTPRDLAKSERRLPRLAPVLVPAGLVIPVAALGLLAFQAHGKVSDRQSRLTSLQAEFDALPKPKGPKIDPSLRGVQAQRASAVALVLGARPAWDAMLADFSRVLPANVWLTAMQASTAHPFSQPAATPAATTANSTAPTGAPAAPSGVSITGFTYAQSDVADLLARLSALPSLQNVQLQKSEVQTVGTKDVIQFTILADLREAGGGA